MRNLLVTASILLSVATITGCETAPNVRVDMDPMANLSTYRTFAFFDQPSTDKARYTTLTTSRLKQATRAQLEKLGYVYDEKSPQLRVNFFLNVADKQEIRANAAPGFYGYRAGFYRAWSAYPYNVETVHYKAGTLSIDLVDAGSKALVWQGVAERRVSAKAVRAPDAAIDKAVSDVFSKFPGASKS